jgi:hypothetical protein
MRDLTVLEILILVAGAMVFTASGAKIQSRTDREAVAYYNSRPVPTKTPNPDYVCPSQKAIFADITASNVETNYARTKMLYTNQIMMSGINPDKQCMGIGDGYYGDIEISSSSCGETDDDIHGPYIQLTDEIGNVVIITASKTIRHLVKNADKKWSDRYKEKLQDETH